MSSICLGQELEESGRPRASVRTCYEIMHTPGASTKSITYKLSRNISFSMTIFLGAEKTQT